MPDRRVRSGAQPGRSTLGGSIVTIRSGMVTLPTIGIRPPIALPATVRGRERNISSASIRRCLRG